MSIEVNKKTQHVISKWAGGTTTQLFIYPENAEYQKRNFLFRISSATVEVERSDFTSLPGFKRKLMILDGELVIQHKEHYSKRLGKFGTDEFDGGWETSAEGKVIDFNLMLAEGVDGSLEHMVMAAGQKNSIEAIKFSFLYVYKGQIDVEGRTADQGDLVVVKGLQEITIKSSEHSELIICSVPDPLKDSAS